MLSIDTVREAIALQSIVHIASLLLLIICSRLFRKRVSFFRILIVFSAMDLFVSVQLNGRVSIFSEESFESVSTCLERLPEGYPAPPMHDLIGSNPDKSLHVRPVYRTQTPFTRELDGMAILLISTNASLLSRKRPTIKKTLIVPLYMPLESWKKKNSTGTKRSTYCLQSKPNFQFPLLTQITWHYQPTWRSRLPSY